MQQANWQRDDELVLEKLKLSQNEKELLEHINLQMEEECKVDRSSAVAGMRFNYIQRACEDTVLKPHESRERVRSRKIDQVLTGKYTGDSGIYRNYGTGILADI